MRSAFSRAASASLLVGASSLAALPGCSLFVPKEQAITIIPSAANAELFVNGSPIGKGRQTVSLSKGDTYVVLARCGSSSGAGEINREWSGTGIADMVGGVFLLVPFLGLISDEGSHKLTPDTLRIQVPDATGC